MTKRLFELSKRDTRINDKKVLIKKANLISMEENLFSQSELQQTVSNHSKINWTVIGRKIDLIYETS